MKTNYTIIITILTFLAANIFQISVASSAAAAPKLHYVSEITEHGLEFRYTPEILLPKTIKSQKPSWLSKHKWWVAGALALVVGAGGVMASNRSDDDSKKDSRIQIDINWE